MTTTPPAPRTKRPARRARRWHQLAAVSLLALAPVALAACGGGNDTASASGSNGSSSQGSNTGQQQKYLECLAKNGVSLPSRPAAGEQPTPGQQGGTPPSMPDPAAMQKAQQACAKLAPQGGGFPGGGFPGGGNASQFQAYRDCLTQHGVTLPDRGQGPQGGPPQGGTPPTDSSGQPVQPGQVQNGQPPQGGTPFGLDTSDPTVAAAVQACQDKAPNFGPPNGQQPGSTTATS